MSFPPKDCFRRQQNRWTAPHYLFQRRIHDPTSSRFSQRPQPNFGRIKQECGGDVNRIAQEIQKIVDERGKFQDPVTKSGGTHDPVLHQGDCSADLAAQPQTPRWAMQDRHFEWSLSSLL
ncbi:MAG: hypothetical protein ACLRWQ_18690 [Flavonifractor plautii]